ncbi:ABC transporter ATP-binding protein [Dokdonella sp.]|uniref:ABC transporter ATP-binding protein n=1 Tax=Dokdonella sp. TaxID=2291710 RepID=UPI0035297956
MDSANHTVLAELKGVRKRYGKQVALDGLDLRLRSGELLAVLGPNGAGKSTAVAALLGLASVDQGLVSLFGDAPRKLAARCRVGVMLQSAGIPDAFKVGELLEVTRGYYRHPRSVEECVGLAGLQGLLERRYGRLSGGQQRRVQFALAICGNPELLFLDEPTTGLDIEARKGFWVAIRAMVAEGCSVFLTTHYLEEAEALADRVVVLNHGRQIAEGSVESLRSLISNRLIGCITSLEPDTVRHWAHVRDVSCRAGRMEIIADVAEPVVRRLLAEDERLAELEIHRGGLAEAFVELTREAA